MSFILYFNLRTVKDSVNEGSFSGCQRLCCHTQKELNIIVDKLDSCRSSSKQVNQWQSLKYQAVPEANLQGHRPLGSAPESQTAYEDSHHQETVSQSEKMLQQMEIQCDGPQGALETPDEGLVEAKLQETLGEPYDLGLEQANLRYSHNN